MSGWVGLALRARRLWGEKRRTIERSTLKNREGECLGVWVDEWFELLELKRPSV